MTVWRNILAHCATFNIQFGIGMNNRLRSLFFREKSLLHFFLLTISCIFAFASTTFCAPPTHAQELPDGELTVSTPYTKKVTPVDMTLVVPEKNISSTEDPNQQQETPQQWQLTAEKLTSHSTEAVVEAEGNVLLTRGEEYIRADYARYFRASGWVYLKGHVEAFFGGDTMKSEEAEFDMANKLGWLHNGSVFMHGPHAYFDGERIVKHWGDSYSIHDARVTTCDGETPAWSIAARDAHVDIDGYATLSHVSMQAANIPFLYAPYLIVPAQTTRQTGFLVPELGSSSQNGWFYNQPFFWAIDDNSDMTLNALMMTDRGVMLGSEYRANFTNADKLWIRGDWLYDQVRDMDGTRYSDGLVRENRNRFWIRGLYDGELADPRWKIKLNIDYVSDQDFMREFKNEMGGYEEIHDVFLNEFGRTINEINKDRRNEFQIYREWDLATFGLSARYMQDPALGHGNLSPSEDILAQRLPQADLFLNRFNIIPGSPLPLELGGHLQAVNFYRQMGSKGMRYDMKPELTLPFYNPYLSVIGTFALRETIYKLERKEQIFTDEGDQSGTHRTLPEVTVTASTEFSRPYFLDRQSLTPEKKNVGQSQWLAVRHSMQPRVEYKYLPTVNQSNNPWFDADDRIGPKNEVVYSLTNVFTRKEEVVSLDQNKNPVVTQNYYDFMRFIIQSGFDFKEAQRNSYLDKYPRRPVMDILFDLTLYPGKYIGLQTRTWISPYTGDITRHSNTLSLSEPSIGSVIVTYDEIRTLDEYRRRREFDVYHAYDPMDIFSSTDRLQRLERSWDVYAPLTESNLQLLNVELDLRYFKPFVFTVDTWYDFKKSEELETSLSIAYEHQCFKIIGTVKREPKDNKGKRENRYQISLALPGFWNN